MCRNILDPIDRHPSRVTHTRWHSRMLDFLDAAAGRLDTAAKLAGQLRKMFSMELSWSQWRVCVCVCPCVTSPSQDTPCMNISKRKAATLFHAWLGTAQAVQPACEKTCRESCMRDTFDRHQYVQSWLQMWRQCRRFSKTAMLILQGVWQNVCRFSLVNI